MDSVSQLHLKNTWDYSSFTMLANRQLSECHSV